MYRRIELSLFDAITTILPGWFFTTYTIQVISFYIQYIHLHVSPDLLNIYIYTYLALNYGT